MSANSTVRLGVNLDHVMTIRQARFTPYPDLRKAIKLAEQAGADGTDEMRDIAIKVKPENCCIVPEHRQELTTEGGLDVIKHGARIKGITSALNEAGIAVSLFIEPDLKVIDASAAAGAPVIELHTGTYASCEGEKQKKELQRIQTAVAHAHQLGLVVNAGHGLHYENVSPIAEIENMYELNIGHSIVAHALFVGMETAVHEMRERMDSH